MKLSTVLLAGSLAANVAVGAALMVFSSSLSSTTSNSSAARASAAQTNAAAKSTNASAASADRAALTTAWAHLKSGDLSTLVARLRAAGFSPALIRAILSAELQERFAERRKAIIGEAKPYEYWKPSGMYTSPYSTDPKLRAALRDLGREQTEMMKTLIGSDATEEDLAAVWRRRQFGNLSKEKVDQINQVTADYSDLEQQVRTAAGGITLKEDRDKLAYLTEEKKKDLAAILTPEELADYELHSSQTTNRMRYQLASLDLTEEQFRAIYQIQKPYEEKYTTAGGMVSADAMRERTEAQKQMQAQVKATLGDTLGAQYEQAMDTNYQAASRVANRLNLPKETAQQVLDTKKDIEDRANAVRMDHNLSPDQRTAQLSALNTEATNRLTATFQGERGLTAYRDNGGYWLYNLAPPQSRR